MPWQEKSLMELRFAFLERVRTGTEPFSRCCAAFGISRKTGYQRVARFAAEGKDGLEDRSRRPLHSPRQVSPEMEARVIELRLQHPAWGGRKLKRRLEDLGHTGMPSASTITQILRRHGHLDGPRAGQPRAWQRFERAAPNQLWQMDFKGHFGLLDGGRCHTLTVLDDHSRFNLVLDACADQRRKTVKERLTAAFRRYGLPEQMTMDNGTPWGSSEGSHYTRLSVWLMRLGIQVSHSRPYHPQTQGKDERFHRTLDDELFGRIPLRNHLQIQTELDTWQIIYNHQRPHEALKLATPASRYQPSLRRFPDLLPPIVYRSDDIVRTVHGGGQITFMGRSITVGKALIGQPIALRPTPDDGCYHVVFCNHITRTINLKNL
jgi:transposase InsO family protein